MRTGCACPCHYNGWEGTTATAGIKICGHCGAERKALLPRKPKGNREQRRTASR